MVSGCQMSGFTDDAGITHCLCDRDGSSPGATVNAYLGCDFYPADPPANSAVADSLGRYTMSLPAGRYGIYHTATCADIPIPGYEVYHSCEDVDGDLALNIDACSGIGCIPNLYLYPETPRWVSVGLQPGRGAMLLSHFPAFDGALQWRAFVEPGSRIMQSEPGFLYYEARVGKPRPPQQGWVVPAHGFRQWAEWVLPQLGWPEAPQRDFLAAWRERLDRPYALAIRVIPPQWLEQRVGLRIVPEPERLYRHWFFIERARPGLRLSAPRTPAFDDAPSELVVLEWGVIKQLPRK